MNLLKLFEAICEVSRNGKDALLHPNLSGVSPISKYFAPAKITIIKVGDFAKAKEKMKLVQ